MESSAYAPTNLATVAADPDRHPQFRRQFHPLPLQQRRPISDRPNLAKQAQSRPRIRPQAGMAAQLAHFHKRNHLGLP